MCSNLLDRALAHKPVSAFRAKSKSTTSRRTTKKNSTTGDGDDDGRPYCGPPRNCSRETHIELLCSQDRVQVWVKLQFGAQHIILAWKLATLFKDENKWNLFKSIARKKKQFMIHNYILTQLIWLHLNRINTDIEKMWLLSFKYKNNFEIERWI